MTCRIALVGFGTIARDLHFQSIQSSRHFALSAAVGRSGSVGSVERYDSLAQLLADRPDISCVSISGPTPLRSECARHAVEANRHVMLDGPPGTTLGQIDSVASVAAARRVTLFTTWHARHMPAVERTRTWLLGQEIRKLDIRWKENVRHMRPGEDLIWEPGGLGVFEAGLDALAILTAIAPSAFHLIRAELEFPENRAMPVAAQLAFRDDRGAEASACFDWRTSGPPERDIHIETASGYALLSQAGARLSINGAETCDGDETHVHAAYRKTYARFARLISTNESGVDCSPMCLVADAFTLGRRDIGAPFHW